MDTRRPRSQRDYIELARRTTAESRSELFGNIADLFLSDDARLSDRERALMTGILRSLIGTVEASLLQELSARLGGRDDLPDALRPALDGKIAEIARPILMRSRALRTPDLVELVKFRSREHQLALAMRPSLATETGSLSETRSADDPIEAALGGGDETLARQASDYLVAESERIDRLKMPLLPIADLPPEIAQGLGWSVAAALRENFVDALSVGPSYIDPHIEAAARAVVGQPASGGTTMSVQAQLMIERMADDGGVTVETLTRLLRSGRIPAFVTGLAHLADVPLPVARRIALRPEGKNLAILCKAKAIDGDTFLALHTLLASVPRGTAQLPADERNSILAFYDKVTKGNARAALEFWRRDPDFVRAMEQVSPVAEDPPASR